MRLRRSAWLLILIAAAPAAVHARSQKPCVPVAQASQFLNKDICIEAHVYDIVELPDGTRFLDVCPPDLPDASCRFTIESLPVDQPTVGELRHFRGTNVRIRGLIRPMHGRVGMMLSHERQFHGGPPKFSPNPMLIGGFDAEQSRPPVNDPNLRMQGGRRAFMNTRDQVPGPAR